MSFEHAQVQYVKSNEQSKSVDVKLSTTFALPICCWLLLRAIVFRVGITFLSTVSALEVGCEGVASSGHA